MDSNFDYCGGFNVVIWVRSPSNSHSSVRITFHTGIGSMGLSILKKIIRRVLLRLAIGHLPKRYFESEITSETLWESFENNMKDSNIDS